ncbi:MULTISPECIES: SpoIIIAH-like family protein [unclassified Paenibacillus]|uniref:SpoIIIAH-like family protein n=1 Tax=unclassified Paenibacillus TaxID=185978 RepID=UPI0009551CAB|nr:MULTISPECIES: SpoIIIAH-like family protein [unclassified Paenibacillus]ASS65034.1 SpoIIIAH-like family protein [Paenibacillus sp. RUD330]SIQ50846.1 stage III sporulation protein AH [Paenibacillus sp. RU4X]SIQ72969.1 stage III sporulation protein AH [Paenibacillus sp. RU4T]
MNSKRQTVWLVSMLSLMVILSAYYLFTDNSGQSALKDTAQTQGAASGATEVSGAAGVEVQDVVVTPGDEAPAADSAGKTDAGAAADGVKDSGSKEGTDAAGQKTDGQTKASEAKDGAKETSADAGISPEDQAVLQQFEAGSAAGQFTQLSEKSQDKVSKLYDGIMKKVNDPNQTADGSAKALAELDQFESRQDKIESLRKDLGASFKNVVIDENDGAVTVVVQSEKLQRSEAASIIAKVSTSLNVSAGSVLVKYLP